LSRSTGEQVWNAGLSRRQFLQAGAAGLVVVPGMGTILAACGSSTGAPATTGSQGTPDRTAVLRFGQMRGESYDPIHQAAVEDAQLNVLFDTLLSVSPISGAIEPRLATKWDVQPDRVRLHLRSGVIFQDGTPFNADAVKFSIGRCLTDTASNIKTQLYMLDHVEVVDPQTVDLVLKTKAPNPLLMQLTTRPGMIVSPTAVAAAGTSDAFSRKPVGAGMYAILGDWHPRERMSVRAWDGYWDKQAALLGGIDFMEVAMNARVNDLRAGAIDADGFSGSEFSALKAQSHLREMSAIVAQVRGLNINTTIAPFDNPKVRQAIAYAIDRNAFVQALTGGHGKAAYQIFTPDSPAYDASLEGLYKYDPNKSKQLLAEAGYPNGLTFKSIIGATAADYVKFGELLQGQLRNGGITMDLQLVNQAQTIPMLYRQNGHGVAASAPIGSGANARLTDQVIRQTFLKEGFTNAGGVEPPGVRDLIDQGAAATDSAASAKLYKQANNIIAKGLYGVIPIYYEVGVSGYYDYVGGFTRGFTDADNNPDLFRGVYVNKGKAAI
jgi:peptide/nickel transport system substrate-binding protein